MTYGDIKQLNTAGQQVANSAAAVYTTPSDKHALIKTIILHNTNTTTENVALYVGGNTDAYKIAYIGLEANETYEFTPGYPIVIYASNTTTTLQAVTTTASKVNIFIFGRVEA